MKQKIVTALLVAAAVVAPMSASAQKYYARQAVAKGATTAAPVYPTSCDAPQALYTVAQTGTLKQAGTPKLKSLALAKAACETETGAVVCYIVEDTTPATGSVFYASTSTKGVVGYVGSFPGQVNYASYCRPK